MLRIEIWDFIQLRKITNYRNKTVLCVCIFLFIYVIFIPAKLSRQTWAHTGMHINTSMNTWSEKVHKCVRCDFNLPIFM